MSDVTAPKSSVCHECGLPKEASIHRRTTSQFRHEYVVVGGQAASTPTTPGAIARAADIAALAAWMNAACANHPGQLQPPLDLLARATRLPIPGPNVSSTDTRDAEDGFTDAEFVTGVRWSLLHLTDSGVARVYARLLRLLDAATISLRNEQRAAFAAGAKWQQDQAAQAQATNPNSRFAPNIVDVETEMERRFPYARQRAANNGTRG